MFAFIQPFLNLLFFRSDAKDIPDSRSLLKFTLIASFLTDVLGATKTLGLPLAVLLTAAQIAMLTGFVYLLLKLNKRPERWQQTLTAVFGSLALINVASLPFIPNIGTLDPNNFVLTPSLIAIAILQLWFFITMVRILRDALEISTGRAIFLTFLIINVIPLLISVLLSAVGYVPNISSSGLPH